MTRSLASHQLKTVACTALLAAGAMAMASLGSERWVAAGYHVRPTADIWSTGGLERVAAHDRDWLKAGVGHMTPAVALSAERLSFGPLDVVSVTPLPILPGAGPLGALSETGQALVLVTARETIADGSRLIRFIIEAGRAPAVPASAGKGL